jgi:lipooligosaccharide transport system permease protein
MRSWQDFDLIGTIQVALFLFSGTFAPLSVYDSAVLRRIIECSPLYQATDLIRSITLGDLSLRLLGPLAYLIVMTGIGLFVASRRMAKRLLK